MPYSQYSNSGRTLGKCLDALYKLGIPLRIVEEVFWNGIGKISYYNKPFCTFEWDKDHNPIFTFVGEYVNYNSLVNKHERNQ